MRKGMTGLGIFAGFAAQAGLAADLTTGEVELEAATKAERDAGVWVDGQYVGPIGDLDGSDRLVLVPGEHTLTFKLVGYEDLERSIVVDPGEEAEYSVEMRPAENVTYPDEDQTGRVRFEVEPEDAAVFVNEKYVGHVERFDGRKGMRLAPGTYKFTIAMPGYHPFNTDLTVRAEQDYEIEIELPEARYEEQAGELVTGIPQGAR